jgi:hypothetical protein
MTEAREALWLDEVRRGHTLKQIARREGVGWQRIQQGVLWARRREAAARSRESRIRDILRKWDRHRTIDPAGLEGEDARGYPLLLPLFPIGAFTPHSQCPHHGPIRAGSVFCCMVCNRSGMDAHPALQRDPRTDPRPDPKPAASAGAAKKTRKERRRRLQAADRLTSGATGVAPNPSS